MLIRTIHGALARGEEVEAPTTSFGQMMLGSQRGASFVARHFAMGALCAGPDAGPVPTEWTEN